MDRVPKDAPRVALQDGRNDRWLWFGEPLRVLQAAAPDQVLDVVRAAELAVETERLHAVGFVAYDAAPGFDPVLRVPGRDEVPLVWLGLFEPPEVLHDLPEVALSYVLGPWKAAVHRHGYRQAIAAIKDRIAAGYTYQINYTFPLIADFAGDPWSLFCRVARAQRGRYAAYVDTGRHVVCSASPELFFDLEHGTLTSRPMKGTAPRGRTLADDEAQRAWLQSSEKNRAENVMIVDMIRNDMGRIAEMGSVHVPRLFEVERYPTVFQMTSTVSSRTTARCSEILAALFPCASITGAPKVSAMRIIADLEPATRGVYTGAIGYLAPGGRAQFNVAIRTVVVDRLAGRAVYGVGSGVVWDSDADEEYDECLLKGHILTARPLDFQLLETMLWQPGEGIFLLDRHLRRLADSAEYFGFLVDLAHIKHALATAIATLPSQAHRVRLLVDHSGSAHVEVQALSVAAGTQPVRLGLAIVPVDREDVFLYHKTTQREGYDAARRTRPDCDDVLLWNQQGEITETCLANVAVRLAGSGELITPPVACGLLAGTLRSELLDAGVLSERVLRVEELACCEAIFVFNSVRGWRGAELVVDETV